MSIGNTEGRDQDVEALGVLDRAMRDISPRMWRATLEYLWDKYVVHPRPPEPVASPVAVPPLTAPVDLSGVGGSTSNEWETCALARFFRDNPNEKSANLYCGCPKCSPTCSVQT